MTDVLEVSNPDSITVEETGEDLTLTVEETVHTVEAVSGPLSATQLAGNPIVSGSPSDDDLLQYDAASGKWEYVAGSGFGGVTDHGALTGLGDDDHPQYHTDARALTWLGTRSTDDLPEGSDLYFTDARADARIAAADLEDLNDVVPYASLTDGEIVVYNAGAGGWRHRTLAEAGVAATGHTHAASDVTSGQFADARISESSVTQHEAALAIAFTQLTGSIADAQVPQSAVVQHEGAIDHDALTGFVASEHVDHSGVTVTGGTGLSGGGDLTASRVLALSHLGIEALVDPNADRILYWDDSAGASAWLTPGTGVEISVADLQAVPAEIDHDALLNYVANQHVDHGAVSISGGQGISGGGDLTASRTLDWDGLQVEKAGTVVGTRRILNLIEGTNVTLTVTDDGSEIDVEVAASGGSGSAIILDLGDDGVNESSDLGEVATTGDTNSIFSEPTADKLLIDVGLNWPGADDADALGGNAPSFYRDASNLNAGVLADARVQQSNVTQHEGAIDHGSISGLGDDDHTQYHTDARALTWLGTRSTSDLPEGTNLYYTDARADARIAAALLEDLSDVVAYSLLADGEVLVYNGAAGGWRHRTLAEAGIAATGHTHAASDVTSGTFADARISESSVTQHEGAIDHDALLGFVAAEHLDWTADQGATNIVPANFPHDHTEAALSAIPNAGLANSSLTVTAGDGLKNGGSVALGGSVTVDVEPADFAGTGLEDDGADNLRIAAAAAGNGLTGGGGSALAIATDGVALDELDLSIAPSWTGIHTFGAETRFDGKVFLREPTQDYVVEGEGDLLKFRSQSANTDAAIEVEAFNSDGLDEVAFILDALGDPSAVDSELLRLRYVPGGPRFEVETEASGTGTVRPLHLLTGANAGQVVLNTDGTVTFASTPDVGGVLAVLESRSLVGGDGIAALGDLSADRTIAVDLVASGGLAFNAGALEVDEANVDHDALSGFVADEHVAHSSVSISAGTGLSGGGDISASRTLNLSHLGLEALVDPNADRLIVWDDSAGATAWATLGAGLAISATTISVDEAGVDHDALSGFVASEHVDHSAVSITAGDGLKGGGDLTATRSLDIEPADFAGAFLADDGADNLAVQLSSDGSLEDDGTGAIRVDATGIAVGTLADGRLSANVPLLNAANTWTSENNWDEAFDMAEVATPANPAAGRNKLYFKSDGGLYKLDDAGNEAEIGGGGGDFVLLQTSNPSGVSAIDFSLPSGYGSFVLVFSNVQVSQDRQLWIRLSPTGTGQFDSGSSDYGWVVQSELFGGTGISSNTTSDSEINLVGSDPDADIESGFGETGFSGTIELYNPLGSDHTRVSWHGSYINANGNQVWVRGSGLRNSAEANDDVRVLPSSGNLDGGEISLYGRVN